MESANQEPEIFIVGADDTRMLAKGPKMEIRYFYTQPLALGDIGAGENIALNNASFVGSESEHNDPVKNITAANVGIFARDVFDDSIFYFGGVGVFKGGGQYEAMKNIRAKAAPHRTSGCERRMKGIWEKKKRKQLEWDK